MMNEKIKQLAEQAGLDVILDQHAHEYGNGTMANTSYPEVEKFAELIVRDTLDQVAEFNRLTTAYQTQGIDPEIDVTKEVLKNYGFTRFPIGVE